MQRGFSLPAAALASAARRFSEVLSKRTTGLPVGFILAATLVAAIALHGRNLLPGGTHHG